MSTAPCPVVISPGLDRASDLFGTVGIDLPLSFPPETPSHVIRRAVTGRQWWVISNPQPVKLATAAADDVQLELAFPAVDTVVRVIPRSYGLFLNASLAGFLAPDRRQLKGAMHQLEARGLLYVGDLIRVPEITLAKWLGKHAPRLDFIRDRLAAVGLEFGACADWWRRPADFYDCAP